MAKAPQMILRILRSSTQKVMSLTFIGMLSGILMDVTIAGRFGATALGDTVIVALLLPQFLDTIIREGTKFSLIPLLVTNSKKLSVAENNRRLSALFNGAFLLGVVLLVLFELVAGLVISRFAGPGLSAENQESAAIMLRLMGAIFLLAPMIAILSAHLNSIKKFSFVALRNSFIPAAVLLGLFLFWAEPNLIYIIAASYSIGFIAYFLLLLIVSMRFGFAPKAIWMSKEEITEVRQAVSWPTFGFVARQGGRLLEKSIASLLAAGSVSAYFFAFRIFSAIQTVIGTSIATTGLPDLSDAAEVSRVLRRKIIGQLKKVLLLVVPIIVVFLFFAHEIISLIYERGNFDAEAVGITTRSIQYLLPGLVFFTMTPVLNSALYALRAYRKVFYNMLFLSVVNVALAWFLSQQIGVQGIALSVSITAFLGNIVALILLKTSGIHLLGGKSAGQ